MKSLPLALLLATSMAVAAPVSGPGVDLITGANSSLDLVFQAGEYPVVGFDLRLHFNSIQIDVVPDCVNFTNAVVTCEVVDSAVRIMVQPNFEIPILELETDQFIGHINYTFLEQKAPVFIIIEENYFDSNANSIKARKGKKRWRGPKP